MQTELAAEIESEAQDLIDGVESQTPGDILIARRQELGLNEKEVADQLHITMHYVKALETNQYDKLPGAVFARGYLKSYAELLELDVEDLLARYDVINEKRQADIQEASRQVKARKKKDRNKPLVIISLLIFVSGFLGLWLANSFFGADTLVQTPTASAAIDAVQSLRDESDGQLSPQGQLSLQSAPEIIEETVADSTSSLTSPAQADFGEYTVPATNSSQDLASVQETAQGDIELADIAAALQTAAQSQSTDLAAASPSAATSPSEEQPRVITIDATGDDVLRLSFSGESWVEVNDGDSQQIYRDIREAGDILEITGNAPFNILLGDAPFTRMSLNGDEIDLSSDIRIDNSARLTVGL